MSCDAAAGRRAGGLSPLAGRLQRGTNLAPRRFPSEQSIEQFGEAMPAFVGFILGVLVTIGGAYVYDASTTGTQPPAQTSVEQRPMVNWDVVNNNWHGFTTSVRRGWNRLASSLHHAG